VALVREDGPGALYIAFGQAGPQAFYRLVAGLAASTQTTAPRPAAAAPETQEPLPLLRSRGGAEIRLDRAAETPPQLGDEASPLAQQWLEHLRGKKVSFLESYSSGASGGYAMRRDFYLCSDGRFSFRENSSVSIYVPGASAGSGGRSSGEGRWRVLAQGEHAVLELAWSDGAVAVRRLEYAEGRTYIDGERWYVTEENDLCG
jgi:hypothetical protein